MRIYTSDHKIAKEMEGDCQYIFLKHGSTGDYTSIPNCVVKGTSIKLCHGMWLDLNIEKVPDKDTFTWPWTI